jgi:tRNA(fMet)-specific endonuclease VapC
VTGRYLLDTNIVIGIFNGESLLQHRVINTPEVFLSIVSLGELFYGARNSHRVQENVTRIEQFATSVTVLDCDSETARRYGMLKVELRERGTPLPENDIWIAALASQHDLALVTRDQHFSAIAELRRESW